MGAVGVEIVQNVKKSWPFICSTSGQSKCQCSVEKRTQRTKLTSQRTKPHPNGTPTDKKHLPFCTHQVTKRLHSGEAATAGEGGVTRTAIKSFRGGRGGRQRVFAASSLDGAAREQYAAMEAGGWPVEAEGGTSVAAPAGWLFWNLMAHPLEKTLHRHRAGFEPQRASSFMKRVKASQILGEAVRA